MGEGGAQITATGCGKIRIKGDKELQLKKNRIKRIKNDTPQTSRYCRLPGLITSWYHCDQQKTKQEAQCEKHSPHQCDQMPGMFAQYLAISNNVNWPKSTLNFPKQVQKFAKYLSHPKKLPIYFKHFAKGTKFLQIQSHCSSPKLLLFLRGSI